MKVNKTTMMIEDFEMDNADLLNFYRDVKKMVLEGDITDFVIEKFEKWCDQVDVAKNDNSALLILTTTFPIRVLLSYIELGIGE